MVLRLAFVIIVFIPTGLFAQHFSKLGRFSIEYEKGCSPTTINITQYDHLEKPRSFYLELHLDSITPSTKADTFYTYSEPRTYKIVQLIGEDISPKTDTLIFTIESSPPPNFEVYSCSGDQLEVNITDQQYDYYRVFFTNTDSIDVRQGDVNPQFSYISSFATIVVKGLFDNAFNSNCSESIQSTTIEPSLFSPIIDTAFFAQSCDNSYSLSMQISNLSSFKYIIELEDNAIKTQIHEGLMSEEMVFENLALSSNQEICINISAIDPCTGQSTSSDPYCISTDLTEIGNFQGAYASYSGSNMLLYFGNTGGAAIKIQRTKDGSSIRLPDQFGTKTIDPISSSKSYLYSLSFLGNDCDTINQRIDLQAINIEIESKGQLTNIITLNVTEPINSLNSLDRTDSLLLYNQDSTRIIKKAYSGSFNLEPTLGELQNIRLFYHYPNNGISIYSNAILTRLNFIVHVPKAFTPFNYDGLNDRLLFYGLPGQSGNLQIYNRWGELIYESDDILLGWDGRSREGRSPQGTYRYKLSFTTPEGELKSQVGTFVLIRN